MPSINDFLRSPTKNGMAGIWLTEEGVVAAARKTREAGFVKFDAILPFPSHHIDEAMQIPRSWIPWVTFVFGLTGCIFGVWLTWWTSVVSYPLLIGGKPMWSIAAFIPVIFECTILFAALSSVGAMVLACGLPKVDPPIIDPDLTSHKWALFIPEDDNGYDEAKIESLFKELGADNIKRSEF